MTNNKVHLVFYMDDGQEYKLILFQRKQDKPFKLLHTTCVEQDNHCKSTAAARIIIDKFGELPLSQLSISSNKHLAKVDYDHYNYVKEKVWDKSCQDEQKYMKYYRHELTYIWGSFFNDTPIWNDDLEDNFYYFIKVNENDIQIMKQYIFNLKIVNEEIQDKDISQVQQLLQSKEFLQKNGRQIIFFNFKPKGYGQFSSGFFLDVVTYYNGIFRKKYDNWMVFSVAQNELPTVDQIKTCNYIIMPGSSSCVYSCKKWIENVKKLLYNIYYNYPKIKILGVCFGLQLMTLSLGGKVEQVPNHFIFGNCEIHYDIKKMKQFKLFKDIELQQQCIINQAHGDQIVECPNCYNVIAQSDSCKYEVIISSDERFLGFQGHPEYSTHQFRILNLENNCRTHKFQIYLQKLQESTVSQSLQNLQLCKRFLVS